jgi:hypothetical protein
MSQKANSSGIKSSNVLIIAWKAAESQEEIVAVKQTANFER